MTEREPDEPRAKAAIERMNYIHAQYKISNEDYLYVLSVFIVEPIRWVERFGFRDPHPKERVALHLRWKDIARQMGIKDIPNTYEETEKYLDDYEEKCMVYAGTNVHLANSTMDLFLSVLPVKLRPMCKPAVHALCHPRLRKSMGFPTPHWSLVFFIEYSLKVAGLFVRYFCPPRTVPKCRTPRQPIAVSKNTILYPLWHPFEKTYEHGYKISELGPERFCPVKS